MLDIQQLSQTPLLIYIMVSHPYSINLDEKINGFQAKSNGYCLVTAQLTTFASQNLTQLKRQCRTGGFSVTDGSASILFQSLMLKYVSHYSWLQADRICYPRLLPFFCCWNVQIWKFLGGCCGDFRGDCGDIFYHPSRWAGALPGDVVTDAAVLARAPLLALGAVLPGGTQVLTAVQGWGQHRHPSPQAPALFLSSLALPCVEQRAVWHTERCAPSVVRHPHNRSKETDLALQELLPPKPSLYTQFGAHWLPANTALEWPRPKTSIFQCHFPNLWPNNSMFQCHLPNLWPNRFCGGHEEPPLLLLFVCFHPPGPRLFFLLATHLNVPYNMSLPTQYQSSPQLF